MKLPFNITLYFLESFISTTWHGCTRESENELLIGGHGSEAFYGSEAGRGSISIIDRN